MADTQATHRRGCFAFVASQLLFGFVGAFIGIGHRCMTAAGSFAEFWDKVLDGSYSMPAARIGPEFLVIVVGIIFAAFVILLFAFTLQGILAGFVGWLGGVVAGGLYDLIRLRGKLAPDDPFIIKRVAGYGSVVGLVLSLMVLRDAPLATAAGVFCATGFILHSFGAVIGVIVFLVRRRRGRSAAGT